MTNQVNEGILCAANAALTGIAGAFTVAFVWRPSGALQAQGLINLLNAGGGSVLGCNPYSDALVYVGNNQGFTSSNPTVWQPSGLPWRIDVFTKVGGGTNTIRYHEYRFDTVTWAHADKGSFADGTNGPITQLTLGKLDGDEALNGKLAVAGVWDTALSDGDIETLEATLQAWVDLTPAGLWAFNTDDVASGAVDLTAGGADEISHSGTSFSAEEPSPFDYTLAGGGQVDVTGTAALGGLSAAVAVERVVSATGTAPLGGLSATGALARSVALSGAVSLGGLTAAGVITGGAAAVLRVRIGGQLVESAMVGSVRVAGVAVAFG
jgi:hypothetical protein